MNIENLKTHYNWGIRDEENLSMIRPFMLERSADFVRSFYGFLHSFDDMEKYLKSKEIIERHQDKVKQWFIHLFTGVHDDEYFRGLFKIGLMHVKIGLPPHYVNASIAFIRDYINEVISEVFSDRTTRDAMRTSCSKILDLNLDVIGMSYREEELREYLSSSRIQKFLIESVSRFSLILDIFLMLFLTLLAVIASVVTIAELAHVVFGDAKESAHAIVGILGNLLILWSISELLQEGIKHLRGGRFAIKSFISVGLAACIREILIASLDHKNESIAVLTATVLSLGVVYYLLTKSEVMKEQ